jgi:hypothetical protein
MKPCVCIPRLCADNVAVGALSARDIIVQQILADLGRLAAARVAAYQNHRVLVDLLQDGRLHGGRVNVTVNPFRKALLQSHQSLK